MASDQVKDVPRSALRFSTPLTFAAGDAGGDGASKGVPVEMVARSGQPIEHWYWGNVIHDLSGMKLAKDRIPIDYCHDDKEVIGYLDKFDSSSGDLVCKGQVIQFTADDRAAEVLHKQSAGVPYEASINFAGDGIKVEYLQPGQVADVNGRRFEGPGVIVREWPLRGVAICPYGADGNTSTEFTEGDGSPTVQVRTFTQESPMDPKKLSEGEQTDEEKKASEDAAAEEKRKQEEAEKQKKQSEGGGGDEKTKGEDEKLSAKHADAEPYVKAFGEKGALWFVQGKPFAECAALFNAQQSAEIQRLTKERDDAVAKLAAAPKGNDAVTFSNANPEKKGDGDGKAAPTELGAKIGENLAKVASAFKMPTAATAAPAKK